MTAYTRQMALEKFIRRCGSDPTLRWFSTYKRGQAQDAATPSGGQDDEATIADSLPNPEISFYTDGSKYWFFGSDGRPVIMTDAEVESNKRAGRNLISTTFPVPTPTRATESPAVRTIDRQVAPEPNMADDDRYGLPDPDEVDSTEFDAPVPKFQPGDTVRPSAEYCEYWRGLVLEVRRSGGGRLVDVRVQWQRNAEGTAWIDQNLLSPVAAAIGRWNPTR